MKNTQASLGSENDRSQRMKDYRLMSEFKYLMQHAPSGVYLLPEVDVRRCDVPLPFPLFPGYISSNRISCLFVGYEDVSWGYICSKGSI